MKWILVLSTLFLMTISTGCGFVKDTNSTIRTVKQLEKEKEIGIAQAERDRGIGIAEANRDARKKEAEESRRATESRWSTMGGIFFNFFFAVVIVFAMILFYRMFIFTIPIAVDFYTGKQLKSSAKYEIPEKNGIVKIQNNFFIVKDGERKMIDSVVAQKLIEKRGG